MAIRMTGMFSGLDTDSLVEELVSAQKSVYKKTEDKKVKLEWQQEKWADLNTKLLALYDDDVSSLRLQKSFLTNKATASDETKVSVTAGIDANLGTHQIEVSQLASSQYVTSGQITTDGFGTSTKLSSLGFTSSNVVTITNGSKTVDLDVTESTTVNDFLSACKSAGLNASYDTTQKRIFISSTSSGSDNSFTITTGSYTSEGTTAKEGITSLVDMSNSKTASSVNTALTTLKTASDTTSAESTLIGLAKSAVNAEASTIVNSFYKAVAEKNTSLDEETIAEIEAKYADVEDEEERNKSIEDAKTAKLSALVTSTLASEEYQTKISEALENGIGADLVASELGITDETEASAYYVEDQTTRTVLAETSMQSAIDNYKSVYSSGGEVSSSASDSPLKYLGLGEITDASTDISSTDSGSFALVSAKDSIVNYNGVELVNSSNTVSVNGITVELKGVTDSPITVNVSKDTESIYNSIKEFVNEYNTVLKEMNTLYYADSSRGYDPLSDDEKEAMTDSEIEKWETKIKDSLLRRDSTLGSLLSSFRSALSSSVNVNGKNYSLSSLGIGTGSDYTEYGLLHIDGDDDDSTTKDKTNKLENLLNSDPDLVMNIVNGVMKNLYSTMTDKMKSTTLSSTRTFYNDKGMKTQVSKYETTIKENQEKLEDLEDRYYDQFSAMETALATLQSQSSALSSLMGS